jgi:surface antigen
MKLFLFFLKSAPFLICFWFAIPYILGEDKIEELPKTGDIVGNDKVEELPKTGDVVGDDKVEDTPVELPKTGDIVTTYRTIPVYSNGDNYTLSYGKHYSENEYYYGQKWQCVEFVKRFYHNAFNHQMPSVWGHAKGYYDPTVLHGKLNKDRGMVQFKNGGDTSPQPDDLLVFDFAPFGHVSVISAVKETEIEVVQQNIAGKPRQIYRLEKIDGLFTIVAKSKPVGWLRLPSEKLKNPVFPVESQPTPAITPAP